MVTQKHSQKYQEETRGTKKGNMFMHEVYRVLCSNSLCIYCRNSGLNIDLLHLQSLLLPFHFCRSSKFHSEIYLLMRTSTRPGEGKRGRHRPVEADAAPGCFINSHKELCCTIRGGYTFRPQRFLTNGAHNLLIILRRTAQSNTFAIHTGICMKYACHCHWDGCASGWRVLF